MTPAPDNPIRVRAPRLLGLATLLGLGACAAVGPNYTRPPVADPAGLVMAGDEAPREVSLDPGLRVAGPWWRSLGSGQLDALMAEALAGNRTVAAADATLARARAQTRAASGALYPSIDGQAGLQRERINLNQFGFAVIPNPTINLFTVGGTVSYDLDLFGANRRRLESARAREAAQARRADAAYLTLTGNVALGAVTIADFRGRIGVLQSIVADDRRNLEVVRAALQAGGQSQSSGAAARTQLAQDEALLPPLEQQLAQARHALAVLVGRAPAQWSAPAFDIGGFAPPARIPAALPSELVSRRPDIRAAEDDLHAATAEVGVATANLYPDIRLTAGLAQGALTPGSLFNYASTGWNFGSGLTAPLFHGGSLRAARQAAEAQARASLALYEQTILEAFAQVSDTLTALAHDDDDLAALTRAQQAADDFLKDARAAFALGGAPYLTLIQAQRQANRARLGLAGAQGQRLADIVRLYAATAADWGAPRPPAG